MKRTLRNVAVWILAGLLFTSSTGVSIHKIYCHCKGMLASVMLCSEDPCAALPCCSETNGCHEAGTDDHSCATCIVTWVKADWVGIITANDSSRSLQDSSFPLSVLASVLLSQHLEGFKAALHSGFPHPPLRVLLGNDRQALLNVFRC